MSNTEMKAVPPTNPENENQPKLSFGEQFVGLNFNPSNDPKVQKVKQLCAQLADLVVYEYDGKPISGTQKLLMDHALGEILNAQMTVVKLLTFKS